jgi:nucleotide-binding universal stress UspA family protein
MSTTPTVSSGADTTDHPSSADRIVIGVDGSAASVEALRWAATYATAFDCKLEAITTWCYPNDYGYALGGEGWRPDQDAAVALDGAIKQAFGDAVPAGLTRQVREGHAARILTDASEGARLLVLGSRGHGGFTGLLLGSVSTYCAEHAHCPVVIDRTVPGASAP